MAGLDRASRMVKQFHSLRDSDRAAFGLLDRSNKGDSRNLRRTDTPEWVRATYTSDPAASRMTIRYVVPTYGRGFDSAGGRAAAT